MEPTDLRSRIAIDPAVMAGKPVIRGTRLTVQFILGLLQSGADFDEILGEYSGLQREDIEACLLFAKENLDSPSLLPLAAQNDEMRLASESAVGTSG